MVGRIRMAEGMDVDVGCWSEISEDAWFCETCRMVPSVMLRESVELERVWRCVLSKTSMLKMGMLKLGMTDVVPCGRVDPMTENDGRHERPNVRESFAHDGDKHVDERKHRT